MRGHPSLRLRRIQAGPFSHRRAIATLGASISDLRLTLPAVLCALAFFLGTRPVAGAGPAASGPSAQPAPFEFRPGVIVDLGRGAAYLMNPAREIEAIDLSSGAVLWTASAAARPLAACGDLLVAQARSEPGSPELPLRAFDLRAQGRMAAAAIASLPAGVVPTVVDALGSQFRAAARCDGTDAVVTWDFVRLRFAGTPAVAGQDPIERRESGSFRWDMKADRVRPSGAASDAGKPLAIPAELQRLAGTEAVPGPLWRTGDLVFGVRRVGDGDSQRIALQRWDATSARPLPEVILEGAGLTVRYPSADHRHLLASKAVVAAGQAAPSFQWSIYSVETGERVARFDAEAAGAWFVVWRGLAVREARPALREAEGRQVEEPLRLRAVHLRDGSEAWSRPFRDIRYREDYPPAPSRQDQGGTAPGR